MNTITVIGRLTKDPEIKWLEGGQAVTTLSVADNQKVKGEKVTLFFDVTIWGKRGETAAEYLKKGQEAAFSGKLLPVYVKGEKAYLKLEAYDFSLGLGPKAGGGDDF